MTRTPTHDPTLLVHGGAWAIPPEAEEEHRIGVRRALQSAARPDRVYSVFAGQDQEATARARQHFGNHPPSSPSLALFRNGELVHFVPRSEIESRTAEDIAQRLSAAFEQFCGQPAAAKN